MNRSIQLLFLCSVGLAAIASPAADPAFVVDNLADGVQLYRPVDSDSSRSNSLVVERDDGLLVVDAQPTPHAARELLDEIARRHSAQPVRYLVYSHSHAEAAGGASAFPASTLVIGSTGCQAALSDPAYDFGAEMRLRADDPVSWVEPERRPPVLVMGSTLLLDDARQPVELFVLGKSAHSRGDMIISLPAASIYHLGALLFIDGNPYASDGNVGSWLNALSQGARERSTSIVGLRGPAVDHEFARRQRDALAWIRGQVNEGFIDKLPLDGIEQRILETDGIGARFDMEASPSFVPTLVRRAVEEGADHRRKRGLPFVERSQPSGESEQDPPDRP